MFSQLLRASARTGDRSRKFGRRLSPAESHSRVFPFKFLDSGMRCVCVCECLCMCVCTCVCVCVCIPIELDVCSLFSLICCGKKKLKLTPISNSLIRDCLMAHSVRQWYQRTCHKYDHVRSTHPRGLLTFQNKINHLNISMQMTGELIMTHS